MQMSPIALSLRAQPAVQVGGKLCPLQPVDAALLTWLALQGLTPRGRLAELLWPDGDASSARGALRQRLYKLRQTVGHELVAGQQVLGLAPGVLHDLEGADTLLQGLSPVAGGEFADWLAHERDRRRSACRERWTRAVQAAEAAADCAQALKLALDWLDAEPELEAAHRSVIRLHYLLGDRAAALAAYLRCEQVLRRSLGLSPGEETRALRALLDTAPAPRSSALAVGLPATLLRPPRLVGREADVGHALTAWSQGRVVALVAEAGMGKSRLLQHLAAQLPHVASLSGPALGTPSQVLVAARPGDAAVPLSTLARLLRALPALATPIDAPSRQALATVLPDWQPGPDLAAPLAPGLAGAGTRLLLQRAVQQLLDAHRQQAQAALGLVAIDDLHFADAASLQLLQALLLDDLAQRQGSPGQPLRWALAYRPAESDGPLHQLHDALLETLRVQHLALAPLNESALAELVDSLGLPGLDGAALAPVLWRRTGGNPMFVLETLKLGVDAIAPGAPGTPGSGGLLALGRPASVTRLIERRLAQLSPAALSLARCAAVAGTEFDTPLAVHVLQTPALALADAWAELEAAGVLRDQAFAHDLVFEATLASVPVAIARHLHAEVAQQLEGRAGVAPATLGRHWLAAGQPARAAPHLRQAADAAARAYDVLEAARLWGQLADMHAAAGQAEQAFEAALAAANALRTQTTGVAIETAIQRLETLARTDSHRAAVCKQQAELCLAQGDVQGAAAHTARGLQLLDDEAPVSQRVALLNAHGVLQRRLGQLVPARQTLEQALALSRSAAQAGSLDPDLPSVLNNLGLVLQEQDQHLEAIALMQEAAERQPDPTTRARVLNNLAISLEERGQVQLAHEHRLAALRAVAGSQSLVEAMLCISLGASARSLCRWREAMAHLERARSLGQQHHREDDLQRQAAAMWLQLGRVNLAREALDRAQAATHSAADEAVTLLVRARLALQLHQPEQALQMLATAKATLLAGGYRRALRRVWLVEAMALPPQDALALMEKALEEPAASGNAGAALPLHVRLSQACLALGQHERALRAAERAADWLGAVQPLDMSPAEVWLTLARAAQACGQAAEARRAVQQGLAFVEQVAQEHLDEMYRDGWRRLNPVNAELRQLAARVTPA